MSKSYSTDSLFHIISLNVLFLYINLKNKQQGGRKWRGTVDCAEHWAPLYQLVVVLQTSVLLADTGRATRVFFEAAADPYGANVWAKLRNVTFSGIPEKIAGNAVNNL